MASKNFLPSSIAQQLVEGRLNQTRDQRDAALIDDFQATLSRVIVLEVIFDPFLLNDTKINELMKTYDIKNDSIIRNLPRNTIIGRNIRSGTEVLTTTELFLPFMPPHIALPVKPGEHVWVIYDDISRSKPQGYWMWRVSELRQVDDPNYTHSDRRFIKDTKKSLIDKVNGTDSKIPSFPNGVKSTTDVPLADTASLYGAEDAYKTLITKSDSSKVIDYEDVPRYTKRPGDFVLEGTNNSLIVLGTDRTGMAAKKENNTVVGTPDADQRKYAAMLDFVVGRGQTDSTSGIKVKNELGRTELDKSLKNESEKEGNPDFDNDSSRLYLAMKTKVDKNFKIEIPKLKNTSDEISASAALKSDQVRLIARQDIKILVQPPNGKPEDGSSIVIKRNGDIIFTPSKTGVIKLGGEDADRAILCTGIPANNANGNVSAEPIFDTMGGAQGGGAQFGTFATKLLVKAE